MVVNATGPFSDSIRHMDNPEAPNIVQPSAGIHIMLPSYYSPRTMGLLDPATSDGRVIFFLPWQGEGGREVLFAWCTCFLLEVTVILEIYVDILICVNGAF